MIEDFSRIESFGWSRHTGASIVGAIVAEVGVGDRVFVEFGSGATGKECTTGKLRHDGWTGLWMDGLGDDVLVKKEYVTAENINALLDKHGMPEYPDVLAIDIDGVDWWVWRAVSRRPRVVVIEYNASCGPEASVTVPYRPDFKWDRTAYFGASLEALARLGRRKGYTLVWTCRIGVDAFFVRDDLVPGHFVVRPVARLWRPQRYGPVQPDGTCAGHPPSNRKMQEVLENGEPA